MLAIVLERMMTTGVRGAKDRAGTASAENGAVVLDGPSGVAVTLTADAADCTAYSLHRAARIARRQQSSL